MKPCAISLSIVMGWWLAAGCTSSESEEPAVKYADAGVMTRADASPALELLIVDDWYAASGYMGDGESPGAVADTEDCSGVRGGLARGLCHRFRWEPVAAGWAGVFWQFPEGNWGELPGLSIPAGASDVSFYGWGEKGGEVVTFVVGMGDVDGFEAKLESVVMTTEPTQFKLPLAETGYGEVVGGFGWVAADSDVPVVFFIDDIVWE